MAALRRGEGRVVFDPATATVWYVRETDAASVPGARGARCLIWHARGRAVRLWTYPTNWESLADAELLVLVRGPIA